MLNQPASTTRQLGRHLLAAPLVLALALGYSAAHAQVAPTPVPAQKTMPSTIIYYVDGEQVSTIESNALDSNSILSIDVIKDAAQMKALGHASADGVALITTKDKANSPAVLAFNKRFPVRSATAAQNASIAAATAYIAKTYPSAKLESVSIVSNQTDRYKATFTDAGKQLQLLFDGQGQPVAQ